MNVQTSVIRESYCTSWFSTNASDYYIWSIQFKSWLEHQPIWQMPKQYSKTVHDYFLSNPFAFITHNHPAFSFYVKQSWQFMKNHLTAYKAISAHSNYNNFPDITSKFHAITIFILSTYKQHFIQNLYICLWYISIPNFTVVH